MASQLLSFFWRRRLEVQSQPLSALFAKPRNPRNFSKEFARRTDYLRERARKVDLPSFGKARFHDLRGIHSTALLDAGIPVHTVAQRTGDDPAVLLQSYAKRKRSKKVTRYWTHSRQASCVIRDALDNLSSVR
jgi:integrase